MSEQIETPPAPVTPPAGSAPVVPPAATPPATPPAVTPPAGSDTQRKVPGSYELTLPKDSLLDQAKLAEVAEYAKANKLTNEEAQGILERDNATLAAYVDNAKKVNQEAWDKQVADWANELKNDKEYGGENFAKSAELSKRVVDRFADDQFKKDLQESGFGNHPGFNRFMVKLGKAMAEDQLVLPGTPPPAGERKSTADVLYPNQK